MTRKWIPMVWLQIFDQMHKTDGEVGFVVDKEKDGKTTEEHREGINYIKTVLEKGQKTMPILVKENGDGTYQQLDGFKRAWAHLELGHEFIEAFVCTQKEYDDAIFVPYGKYQMRAWHGGQDGEQGKFPLFEGGERPDFNYDDTIFLFKSPYGDGLRIEVAESIHVHWGAAGRYRMDLGRRDFEALASAIAKI